MTLTLPIPSMRPLLVNHQNMIKYLQRIDDARYYSNFGPLVREYEDRLSKMFNSNVVSTASCTSALTCALLALGLPRGSKCLVQSWTFCGSVAAVVAAGLEPVFADVGEYDWQLTAEYANAWCRVYPEIKVVMPVSQFGYPVSAERWGEFSLEMEIPVIIDAAGCFDALGGWKNQGFDVPICVSTHATKCFSTGEGGFIISGDTDFISKVKKITNYGYDVDRTVPLPGYNAKMSEYHAAIGLAELDWWPEKRQMWMDAQTKYGRFNGNHSLFARSLYPVQIHGSGKAQYLIDHFASHSITARKIWGDGCHTHEAYKHYHRFDLSNTKRLANEVITLPFAIDMTDEEIDYIHEKFTEVVG